MCQSENSSYLAAVALEGSLSAVGVLTCSASIVFATALKLHRQLIYRLVLYQVLAALAFGIACLLEVTQFVVMKYSKTHDINLPLCYATAFLTTFSLVAKLSFTATVTFHVFTYAVCFINLKKLEACYLATSLVVPALMAAIPFANKMYGQQRKGLPYCWILQNNNNTETAAEALVLGSSMIVILPLTAMLLGVLTFRACRRNSDVTRLSKIAIKQMLPLAVYPVSYCLLVLPTIIHNLYSTEIGSKDDDILTILDQIANTGMVWVPGAAFIVHIWVIMRTKNRLMSTPVVVFATEKSMLNAINRVDGEPNERSTTYCSLRTDT